MRVRMPCAVEPSCSLAPFPDLAPLEEHSGMQETIPASMLKTLHEQFPDVAAQAVPAASNVPAAPVSQAAPDGQEFISVPRGYLEYLEGLVQTYASLPGSDGSGGENALPGIHTARPAGGEGGSAVAGGLEVPSIAPATLQLLMQSNK
jgi:hypothetical protein